MNIQITHSWLLEHLETKAKPEEVARYLSLSGPSVERLTKEGKDWVYDIEITTNRVDMMSVRGIAREASVILPQFGIKAKLKPLQLTKPKTQGSMSIQIIPDNKLTTRVMGIILTNIKNRITPKWMKDRLTASGVRSLNAVVDITNYVMLEVGHPTHVFDYDSVAPVMKIAESKGGEKVVSLENKEYKLPGGDIVILNEHDQIIDIPGIIGTKNSIVSDNTKNVLFFNETNDPLRIRKTSMNLGIRTNAAILNEKGVDPEFAEVALLRGIELFKEICNAKPASKIYDYYNKDNKNRVVKVTKDGIENVIGVEIAKKQIKSILENLGFFSSWKGNTLHAIIPSFRKNDVYIKEDIIEEIARIYGYYNLPSMMLSGKLPEPNPEQTFDLENNIRRLLKGLGGVEIYTLSLVSKEMDTAKSLKLKNPLGTETEVLRTSLFESLTNAAINNKGYEGAFHIFEIANVYKTKKGSLPNENLMLGGVFSGYKYQVAKGIIETLLSEINVNYTIDVKDEDRFRKEHRITFTSNKQFGEFGVTKDELIYYEFDIARLSDAVSEYLEIKPPAKFPPQIEDITFLIPGGVYVSDVMTEVKKISNLVTEIKVVDTYKDTYTFRIKYQHPEKTLTDDEVKVVREKILEKLGKKGVIQKV